MSKEKSITGGLKQVTNIFYFIVTKSIPMAEAMGNFDGKFKME